MPEHQKVAVFLTLASAHFFSTFIRAITATLSPALSSELGLDAQQLGLLAGAYFLGFAAMQLPLGTWLDRHGPRQVLLALMGLAVLGCLAFAGADGFLAMMLSRLLCGAGVSACLMGALTGFRHWFGVDDQLRANTWMLMVGSLGMLAATLPVQWWVAQWGWRWLFVAIAAGVSLAMWGIRKHVPPWPTDRTSAPGPSVGHAVWKNRRFWRLVPLGFFGFGGLVAVQTLWAAPWMVHVGGLSALESARGLFGINLAMLMAYWVWGWLTPLLNRRGITVEHLVTWGTPSSLLALGWLLTQGPSSPAQIPLMLTAFCLCSTFVALTQSLVSLSFPKHVAGRALSSYNLVIFSGVFVLQWAIGFGIDALQHLGLPRVHAFQWTFGLLGACTLAAWLFFLNKPRSDTSLNPGCP
jgi:MFS family permease